MSYSKRTHLAAITRFHEHFTRLNQAMFERFLAHAFPNDPHDDASHWIVASEEIIRRDLALYGLAFSINGQRIDPLDVYPVVN